MNSSAGWCTPASAPASSRSASSPSRRRAPRGGADGDESRPRRRAGAGGDGGHQHHAAHRRDAGAAHHAHHHHSHPDPRREAQHAGRHAAARRSPAGRDHRSRFRRHHGLERGHPARSRRSGDTSPRRGRHGGPARSASAAEQAREVRERGDADGLRAAAGLDEDRADRPRAVHPLTNLMLRLFCALMVLAPFLPTAYAQDQAAKAQTVRPEVGKPLQSAIDLLKGKKAKEALAMAREAQAVPNKTPFESYMVTRLIARAAAGAGEPGLAAKAFDEITGSASATDAERRQFAAAAAGQYYIAKDYAKAAELAARHAKLGGTDKSVHTIYVQALYLGNNFAAAAKAISADIDAEEDAGKTPAEEELQLMANAYLHQRDTAGYAKALEKLLTYYPKRDYWLNLVYGIAARPGFSERLALDVARLKIETGTMRTGNEYLEAAQL